MVGFPTTVTIMHTKNLLFVTLSLLLPLLLLLFLLAVVANNALLIFTLQEIAANHTVHSFPPVPLV